MNTKSTLFRSLAVLSVLTLTLALQGCGGDAQPNAGGGGGGGGGSSTATSIKLVGSGASFPFPLYDKWFKDYNKSHPEVRVDYQAKGSGAGIKDFIAKNVDFAASDAAMKDEEIAQVEAGVQLLPMTAGEVVLAFNLEGVKELKLTRDAYVGIFDGTVKKWNDPKIAAANSGVDLPDEDITVVTRGDSSGTTYVFTQHLSEISESWKNGPGIGKKVQWPESKMVAAPKNDGVTAAILQTAGAVGYIEYGYAKKTGLAMASLQNQAGEFIAPGLEGGQAALAGVEMPENLRAWLPDPTAKDAYPIVTYTWLLLYKKYEDPQAVETLKDVIEYCLTEGQKSSDEMGYIPLPDPVVETVRAALANIN